MTFSRIQPTVFQYPLFGFVSCCRDRQSPPTSQWVCAFSARLAAGFADIRSVAELLGIPADEYRNYEDAVGPQVNVFQRITRLFGVSANYLLDSQAVSEREQLAETIASGLAEYDARHMPRLRQRGGSQHFPSTLVAMRTAAGYGTPAAASASLGINPLLFAAHERGARPITPDVLMFYALTLGMRPDSALLGQRPVLLWKSEDFRWWRLQRPAAYSDSSAMVSPSFDWLASDNCARPALVLPLVAFVDGKWRLQNEQLHLPRALLPATAAIAGDTLYAMVDRTPEKLRTIIVDPTKMGVSRVTANGRGELSIIRDEPADKVVDPNHHRPRSKSAHFCVGAYVAALHTLG